KGADRTRRSGLGEARRRVGGGRDLAHFHGSRRNEGRLRPGTDALGGGGSGSPSDRLGRCRDRRALRRGRGRGQGLRRARRLHLPSPRSGDQRRQGRHGRRRCSGADGEPMTEEVNWDGSGLAAVVVQHAATAEVLMLGWMNPRALERTRETGRVTFWSRSREQLWEKGETSGNWLELVEIRADCDGVALVTDAIPHGPTAHPGTDPCWGDSRRAGFATLDRLWDVVIDRAAPR